MTDERKVLKEILFGMYQDSIAQCRHHEAQRATVTSSIIAIDTIIIGLITFDKAINWVDIPLSFLLIVLGIFGATFSLKHYERYLLFVERLRQYRQLLDEQFANNEILRLKNIADEIHSKRFPRLSKYKHHNFWMVLHLLMALIGVVLTCSAIINFK
jgi:hypothetical protein